MPTDLTRRCTVALLAALALATLAGLLAYGPVTLSAHAHEFAGQRPQRDLSAALDLLIDLPVVAAGLWGWRRIRSLPSRPGDSRRTWTAFFLVTAFSGLAGAFHHWVPDDAHFVLVQALRSTACGLLALVLLSERVDARWGTRAAVGALLTLASAGTLWWVLTQWLGGQGDMRPLLWLSLLPVLLALAGAWQLPGSRVPGRDWLGALLAFAAAHLLQLADPVVIAWTGGTSGHTLHHLALAGCVAWLAYCIELPATTAAVTDDAPLPEGSVQPSAS